MLKSRKIAVLFGLILTMSCIFGLKKQAEAEEGPVTFREYVESKGSYYGESGDCMYTYSEDGTEIKIIGFNFRKKKIRIPNEIEGKKVTEVDLDDFEGGLFPLVSECSDYNSKLIKKKNRIKTLVLPRFLKRNIKRTFTSPLTYELRKLQRFEVDKKSKYLKAEDGVLFSKNGRKLFAFPKEKKSDSYTIPKGVRIISDFAFGGCVIKKIGIPDTVREIGECAFVGLPIRKVTLPSKLKKMGMGALSATDIEQITIPGTVKYIPTYCFRDCSALKKVVVEKGIEYIGYEAFTDSTNLKDIYLPFSLKYTSDGHSKSKYGDEPFYVTFCRAGGRKQPKYNATIHISKKHPLYKNAKEWKEYGIKVKPV